MPTNRRQPLHALTGIRFFAALSIFNLHYFWFEHWGYHAPRWVDALSEAQITGVCFFFLLSGFVLSYAYADNELTGAKRTSFWVNRFSRIYPVYFLALIWFAPFILTHRFATEPPHVAAAKAVASFVPALFLIQSWFHPRFAGAWNGPGWTLSVEAFFYLTFPFILRFLRRLSDSGKLIFAGFAILAGCALSLADHWLPFHGQTFQEFIGFNPLFHVPSFLAGAALGLHFVRRKPSPRLGTWLCCAGFAAIFLIGAYSWILPPLLLKNAILLPAFGAVVYGLALGGLPARFFSLPFVVLLGESSYALYILQFSTVFTLFIFADRAGFHDYISIGQLDPRLSPPHFFLLALIFSITVSCLVFRFYETPVRRGIRQAYERWAQRQKERAILTQTQMPALQADAPTAVAE